jgi:hypothetical protein
VLESKPADLLLVWLKGNQPPLGDAQTKRLGKILSKLWVTDSGCIYYGDVKKRPLVSWPKPQAEKPYPDRRGIDQAGPFELCQWPGCTNKPEPRTKIKGRWPKYCREYDADSGYTHNAHNVYVERSKKLGFGTEVYNNRRSLAHLLVDLYYPYPRAQRRVVASCGDMLCVNPWHHT